MITVTEAEQIISNQYRDYGTELLPFDAAAGRILAEHIYCDRDMPAYDRVSMDGIAVRMSAIDRGIKTFTIIGTQAAGDAPVTINADDECVEIMTGAALPSSTDTVIPYEHIQITDGIAAINEQVKRGQNVHFKGMDKKQGDLVIGAGAIVDPAIVNVAATVGKTYLSVKRNPMVVVVSTGDELVAVDEQPSPYQIRRSNSHTIKAVLQQYGVEAHLEHWADDAAVIVDKLAACLARYDVLILSGGVSMGKYDHLPATLEQLGVKKLFHKVKQRPGKPFWFGQHNDDALVFAFPGNPVSAFMCLHRYFIPWLNMISGTNASHIYAVLGADIVFRPDLSYFLQVTTQFSDSGQIIALPLAGNGSGDLANLVASDAFLELPLGKNEYKRGEVYRLWPFKRLI